MDSRAIQIIQRLQINLQAGAGEYSYTRETKHRKDKTEILGGVVITRCGVMHSLHVDKMEVYYR